MEAETLVLDPAPRTVQHARRWVAEACRRRGREDLAESAETGVSELVTNALIHAPGPITVQVRGTADHPRVEVHDVSPEPPRPPVGPPPDLGDVGGHPRLDDLDDLDDLLSTVGRGLRILATSARAWGAETRLDGKVVWFEPAPEPRVGLTEADLAGIVSTATRPEPPAGELVAVRLPGVPVRAYARFRRHYLELRRELRLLGLAHAEKYPQATRLAALFADFETDVGGALDAPVMLRAAATGAATADLEVQLRPSAGEAARQMVRLLDLADEFCAAARLLTVTRSEEERTFAAWLLDQLARGAGGEAARPWRPPTTVTQQDRRYSVP